MNVDTRETPHESRSSLRNAAMTTEESWLQALEHLVQIRKQKKLTQKDVGAALGVTQESISQLESGEANPSVRRLKLYAMAIGASVDFNIVDTGLTPDYHLNPQPEQTLERIKPGPKSSKAPVRV